MNHECTLPAARSRGRPSKFTPERVHQIQELVKSGVGSEEIAAFVGVTSGTLKVSCSKLGISLRRPGPTNGNRWPPRAVFTRMTMPCGARFTVIVRYHDEERATELPLTNAMIGRLALEAATRDLTISELARELVLAVAKQGLVQRALKE
jgi:hypothetical protein